MSFDGMALLQKILQAPEPPKGAAIVVLSAWDEGEAETAARRTKAASLVGRVWLYPGEANTHAEAEFARRDISEGDLIIVTSQYHQLRAFLTFIKAFVGTSVRLWNAPAPSGWEKLEDELAKIEEYQKRGHVATYQEGLEHLAWRDAYQCVT